MHNNVRLDSGEIVTASLVRRIIDDELAAIQAEIGGLTVPSHSMVDWRVIRPPLTLRAGRA